MTGRNASAGLLVLRLIIGWVFLWHGLGKLVGPPFPGDGVSTFADSLMHYFPSFSDPVLMAMAGAVGLLQTASGALLILGWQTSIVSSLLILQVLVSIARVRFDFGLFGVIGWEKDLIECGVLLCLLLGGPGLASLDGRRRSAGTG